MKINIALLITGLGMGGAEKQVCLLADRFAYLGHRVTLISLTGSTVVKPTHHSIELVELSMKKTPWGIVLAYLKLRKLIKNKPDIVHSHMFHANIMARLLRLSTTIKKLVCTAHNTNEGGLLRMFLYRATDFLSDINTNVSKEAVESFVVKKAVRHGNMRVIYNGIDTNKFISRVSILDVVAPENKFVFICVGRLTEQKDYPNLFNAIAILKEQNPDFVVFVVGDGNLKVKLQSMVQDLDLNKNVHFLGVRNDVPALMNVADAFVLSSAWEGFGLVVAEAMACEKPVVATDCGGVAEVLGDCGLLVKPRDSKALAQAMQTVMEMSSEQRENIGRQARQRVVDNFSIQNITQQWLTIYAEP